MEFSGILRLQKNGGFRLALGFYALYTNWHCPPRAVITKTDRVFMCLEKRLIEKAIDLSLDGPAEIIDRIYWINEKKKIAFDVSQMNNARCLVFPYTIIYSADLAKMKKGDLRWPIER
jgi:hypothetical protein